MHLQRLCQQGGGVQVVPRMAEQRRGEVDGGREGRQGGGGAVQADERVDQDRVDGRSEGGGQLVGAKEGERDQADRVGIAGQGCGRSSEGQGQRSVTDGSQTEQGP